MRFNDQARQRELSGFFYAASCRKRLGSTHVVGRRNGCCVVRNTCKARANFFVSHPVVGFCAKRKTAVPPSLQNFALLGFCWWDERA